MENRGNDFPQCPVGKFDGKGNFQHWRSQMELFFKIMEYTEVVINGFTDPGDQANLTQNQREELIRNRKKDNRALMYIYGAIDSEIYEKIAHVTTSKEAWDCVINTFVGRDKVKKANGEVIKELQIVEKILRTLTERFEGQAYEQRLNEKLEMVIEEALQTQLSFKKEKNCLRRSENKQFHAKFAEDNNDSEETLLMAFSAMINGEQITWYLDTSCSNHMSGHKELFVELNESIWSEITFGNSARMPVKGKGKISIQLKNGMYNTI
ncbi:uncharacterized protein LOC112198945 [Rosa chinensis]|uniref:uncharacterized protein LOC112198945 n=1 Tax=Rosa chinensis TaxID=74649 RepID=UPI000D08D714|nr:uncharacterized protein LOC112198945 [Rosa chinensis]